MTRLLRPRSLAAILLLLPFALLAQETPEPEPELPPLPTGSAVVVLDGQPTSVPVSLGAAGPLFALQPLAARLGVPLDVDPLGQSYTLHLHDVQAVIGPGSPAVTIGRDIVRLSQPARAGDGGLQVPLDLLERTLGDLMGFRFEWRPGELQLRVERQSERELSVTVDLVHLQGITTVVLHFPEAPRYRVEAGPQAVDVVMQGDRLRASPQPATADPLVRGVTIEPSRVRLELAPGAAAEHYVLRQPFRLVFDVHPVVAGPTIVPEVELPARRPGLRTIVLDPGHGGAETGAVGRSGTAEKDLTLVLAQTLRRRLEARLPLRVVLTREEDADLPLDTRTALANQFKADLFVSLHLNSAVGAGAHGAETYFLASRPSDERAASSAATENRAGQSADPALAAPAEEDPLYDLQLVLWDLAQTHHLAESQRLAGLIQEELNTTLELRDRGVKQAPFRVLMGAAMPAVLVELGFLSNPQEESKLQDPAYRAQLVEALVRAIARYREQVEGLVAARPTEDAPP